MSKRLPQLSLFLHDAFNNAEFVNELERIKLLVLDYRESLKLHNTNKSSDFLPESYLTPDKEPSFLATTELMRSFRLGANARMIIDFYIGGQALDSIHRLIDVLWDEPILVRRNISSNRKRTGVMQVSSGGDSYDDEFADYHWDSVKDLYPLSLCISPNISKNQFIKFIEENWERKIRPALDDYGHEITAGQRKDQNRINQIMMLHIEGKTDTEIAKQMDGAHGSATEIRTVIKDEQLKMQKRKKLG